MEIDVHTLRDRIQKGDELIIIDVREPQEHAEFTIEAINIPLGTLPMKMYDFDEEAEIILYCRSGMRSASAQAIMLQSGFKKVLNLKGGMLEWQSQFGQ
jgi:rhodanese-related sulfurtransferase